MATINGTSSRDRLKGTTLNDTLNGFGGGDTIYGGLGNDTVNGGDGSDRIYGEAGNDTLNGDAGNDAVYGAAGTDTLNGGLGSDTLYGGVGVDALNGGNGNDVLLGGAGADTLEGGTDVTLGGSDTVSYVVSDIKSGVIIDLVNNVGSDGDAQGDTYTNIENATGSLYDDDIYGNSGKNVLNGGGGNDYILDGAGGDTVFGGEGSDWIDATDDNIKDIYDGGAGSGDILDLTGFDTAMTVNLGAATSSDGSITDTVKGFEIVWGSAQGDSITGGGFGERLIGNTGSDTIRGAGGHDRLWGGDGVTDAAADTFVFQSADIMHATLGWLGHDRIMDFDAVDTDHDIVDISEMLEGIDVVSDANLNLAVTVTEYLGSTYIDSKYAVGSSQVTVCVLVGVTGLGSASDMRTAGLLDTLI